MNIMNKMKFLSFVILATCGVLFASCGSDDEPSVRDKLVGVWKTTMTSSNWKNIELKPDGTLEYNLQIKEDGTMEYVSFHDKAYWIYNEADQTITMYREDRYYNYIYVVSMSNDGNSWNGHDTATGKTYSFIRRNTK